MSKITKKFIAGFTALTCSVMMLGAGAMPVGATISDECRADMSKCSTTELSEWITELSSTVTQLQTLVSEAEGTTTPAPAATTAIEGCEITSFDRNLKVGMTGDDVKCMQIVLNSDTVTTLGSTGAGSPGNETSYFGPKTKAGVIKFQELYSDDILASWGLTKGTGYVGSTTRAQLNVLLSATPVEPVTKACSEITNAVECVTAECSWDAATSICSGEGVTPEPEKTCSEITEAVECVVADCSWDAATTTCSAAVVPTPTGCTCTDWVSDVCGGGDCVSTKMQQTRTCTADEGAEAGVCDDVETTQCVDDTSCVTAVGTGLTVALATDTPAAAAIASGTAYNGFLRVNLTAGSDGDVEVTGIKVTKGGISQNTAVVGIGVFDKDENRHGNMVSSLTAEGTASITFASDPITVTAGTTVPVDIKVNLTTAAAAQSGTIYMSIAAAADITTTAEVSGTFPLTGNTMSLVNGGNTVGALTIDAIMVHNNGTADTSVSVNIGTEDQEIAKFRFQESSAGGNEDITVKKITLYNNGSATDTDFENIDLVTAGGDILATVDNPSSRTIVFDLSAEPYKIDKGTFKDLTVRADVVGGSGRTIRLLIQNDYDVVVSGLSSGSNLLGNVDATSGTDRAFPAGDYDTANTRYLNKVEMASGNLTFEKASDSPSGNVALGASQIVLAKYNIKANGEDMDLRTMTVNISKVTRDLTGTVYVKYNDSTIWSLAASTAALYTTNYTANLTTYPVLTAGEAGIITVVGSVSSSATSSDIYTVTADVTQVKRLTTNDLWDPLITAKAANALTVSVSSLGVIKNSLYKDQTLIEGANDQILASFQFTASSAGQVKVTSIVFDDYVSGTNGNLGDNFDSLEVWSDEDNDGTFVLEGQTLTNVSGTAANTISNLDIRVPAGKSILVQLRGNILTGLTGTAQVEMTASGITGTGAGDVALTTTPAADEAGQSLVLSTGGALAVTNYDTPETAQLVKETTGQILTKLKFTATDVEAMDIERMTWKTDASAAEAGSFTMYDKDGVQIGGSSNVVPSGTEASTTTLSANEAIGQTDISVTDPTVFEVGEYVTFVEGNGNETETKEITAISATEITVAATTNAYDTTSTVLIPTLDATAGHYEIATAGSTTTFTVTTATTGFTPGQVAYIYDDGDTSTTTNKVTITEVSATVITFTPALTAAVAAGDAIVASITRIPFVFDDTPWQIAKNGNDSVTLKASIGEGAQSASQLAVNIINGNDVTERGALSKSDTLTTTITAATGNAMYLYKSKAIVSKPAQGATGFSIDTTPGTGSKVLYFTVEADNTNSHGNEIVFNGVTFTASGTASITGTGDTTLYRCDSSDCSSKTAIGTAVSSVADTVDGTNSDIDGSATTTDLVLTSGTDVNKYNVNDVIRINNELMLITVDDGDGSYTVSRGYLGSTAVTTHADTNAINSVVAAPGAGGMTFTGLNNEHIDAGASKTYYVAVDTTDAISGSPTTKNYKMSVSAASAFDWDDTVVSAVITNTKTFPVDGNVITYSR